jgi:hypothetical protein
MCHSSGGIFCCLEVETEVNIRIWRKCNSIASVKASINFTDYKNTTLQGHTGEINTEILPLSLYSGSSKKNVVIYILNYSVHCLHSSIRYYSYIRKPTHTHTHTLQNPHTHTHTLKNPHIHTPTHIHTHTLQNPHFTKLIQYSRIITIFTDYYPPILALSLAVAKKDSKLLQTLLCDR